MSCWIASFTLCASSSATLDDLVCKFGFDETIFIFGSGSAIQSLEDDHKAVALLDVVSAMLLFGSLIWKKSVIFFDFATTFFSLSSDSLLDFSFSQPLLYFLIFIFKLAKVLRLKTFRLVNVGKSDKVVISFRFQNSHLSPFWFQ